MVYTFKFYVHNDLYFASPMNSQKCLAHTKKGARCRHNVYIGQPYCYQHIVPYMHLKIKPSTIPNSGKVYLHGIPMLQIILYSKRMKKYVIIMVS